MRACVPVGRTLLWEEVRKRKLLGLGAWDEEANRWEELASDERRQTRMLTEDPQV